MTTLHGTTFNVNQFDVQRKKPRPLAHMKADLIARMKESDFILCQETVNIDLAAFVASPTTIAKVGKWGAFQIRNGNNDGHANTAVLYRLDVLDVPTATDEPFLGDTAGTRRRFLAAAQFDRPWLAAGHIMPARDSAGIPEQLANLGKWVKAHPGPVVIGLDRNQCPPGALERATGLKWHGIGIDGFLTNCEIANVAQFPKGYSDHPGVHADITVPDANLVQRAGGLLNKAAHNAQAHHKASRLGRIRAALHHLFRGN